MPSFVVIIILAAMTEQKTTSKSRPSTKSTGNKAKSTSRKSTPSKVKTKKKPSTSKRNKKNTSFSAFCKRMLFRFTKVCFLAGLLLSIPFAIWVWWLDHEVVKTFSGQKWHVPSEVYSAPIVLKSGDPWNKQDLEALLTEAGYRFGRNSQEVGWAARSKTKISAHLRSYKDHTGFHKSARRIFSFNHGLLSIQTVSGDSITKAVLEPQLIGHLYGGNTEGREILTSEQIPQTLITTLLAVEDRNFYSHFGISLNGIARAVWVNFVEGERRQGGSTLTQQLIKNMYLSSERTYTRKLTEVIMAVLLERRFSKDEILAAYINEIYLAQFGSKAIHGFAAASKHFFGRPINELNIAEYALLVGMVKGPSLYNPNRNPERAKARRDVVLNLLYEQNLLSEKLLNGAKKIPLRVIDEQKSRSLFGDYLDLVSFQLAKDFDKQVLATENLKVYTGLNVRAQEAAVKAMRRQVALLEKQDKKLKGLQGAIVVTDTQNGQVKAIVGSSGSVYSGFNRALGAVRPIGSLVKPPLYMLALSSGRFTWLSPLEDVKKRYKVGKDIWQPENYDKQVHGTVPMYLALAKSYNLATLDLAEKMGFDRLGEGLKQLGVERPFTMRPAVALGSLELSPFEVARIYQPIASMGQSSQLGIVAGVLNAQGEILKDFTADKSVPFTNAVLATALDGMTKVSTVGTARRAQSQFPNLRFAAKTGTTNDQRDSWFVGITGDYATTVWLGDDNNKSLSITGGTGAQKVWVDLMKQLNPKSLTLSLPKGAQRFQVSLDEFAIAADRCDNKETLSFLEGTEPQTKTSCLWPF
ncbi:transglycosylase domain-containing protein [Marinomonas sp. 15G1-11]|uniref:Penicillin-binding protein 1B n=1 Tax=Marinomonas phaeophyticola TaxID=3004091 RepID=A0ABT4JVR9_9GAMM|nr:transglycosylase domain-containing protein [Marinomonas sp. 15G1-11]MCZ2721664.1 transglycosylase domain-containing protein [Marinomonas sp. 15G1-11]